MLAGGAEAPIDPLAYSGFSKCKRCEQIMVFQQQLVDLLIKIVMVSSCLKGAEILLLEEYEHAKNREATILEKLSDMGQLTDAYHITSPDFEGAFRAMNPQ